MANNPFIGRREAIGIGIEVPASPGAVVAPQTYSRQMALTLDQKTTNVQNTSALGRVEGVSDSAVTEQWAEGSLNGPVSDLAFGYILLGMLGAVATSTHSGETTVYDNLFTVLQNGTPPTLTFARTSPVVSRRYGLGVITDVEIEVKQNDWAMVTATIQTKAGVTSTETVAYPTERLFTSKHTNVFIANTLAGLSSATAAQLKSVKLKLSRKADRFTPLGVIDPVAFDPEDFNVTGTLVLRYTDTTFETLGMANTAQAMKIVLANTDATIGSNTNPGVTFTMPQVRFDPITLDNNLNQVLSQTVNFDAEMSTTVGYMIQALLVNTKNGYANA